jgi:acetyl-CoA acetyltransferase
MSTFDPDRLPVIVGVGEITQRTKNPEQALEPIALMVQALREGERDARADLIAHVDSVDIVCEYSWPYADPAGLLCQELGVQPARCVYGVVGGESPVRFMHEAAMRIWAGESEVAAVVGAEAQYAVAAADKAGVAPPSWHPRDAQAKIVRGGNFQHPAAVALGANAPINVYPFYENATGHAWGMTPADSLAEAARIWSRFSHVAAANPHAWKAQPFTPGEVSTPTDDNRLISWPYTKRMVANPLVNMGAAIWLTSAGRARALGIAPERLVYVWGGAKANEPRDYLQRHDYTRSTAQEAVLNRTQEIAAAASPSSTPPNWVARELYSCFPVVPKMARRVLNLPEDAPLTATGGLSFFGAPLNNYMSHAAAAVVHALREGPADGAGLLYGQGEYVTKHHAIVVSRQAPASAPVPAGPETQAQADAAHGPVPPLVEQYDGPATVETFTVLYDRGTVRHGVVIARTPDGARLIARVPADDAATLAHLTDTARSPIGTTGEVSSEAGAPLRWRVAC